SVLNRVNLPRYNYREAGPDLILSKITLLPDTNIFNLRGGHRERNYKSVLYILDMLPENTLMTIGFPRGTHPRDMILRGLLVPPLIARPPVYRDGQFWHDSLTIMYAKIMKRVEAVAL